MRAHNHAEPMRWQKRLLSHPSTQSCIAAILAGYLRVVGWTSRWSVHCPPETKALLEAGAPMLVVFWHQRLAMLGPAWTALPGEGRPNMMISAHKDGLIIAKVVSWFGINHLKGSTGKGGLAALRAGVKFLKSGDPASSIVGITPDGPRGPSRVMQMGTIQLAKMGDVPVVMMGYSCRNYRTAGSWDRFMIPLPFTRGIARLSPPVTLKQILTTDGPEAARIELETALNDFTDALDREMGLTPETRTTEAPK